MTDVGSVRLVCFGGTLQPPETDTVENSREERARGSKDYLYNIDYY
jgi:hypothetical protein